MRRQCAVSMSDPSPRPVGGHAHDGIAALGSGRDSDPRASRGCRQRGRAVPGRPRRPRSPAHRHTGFVRRAGRLSVGVVHGHGQWRDSSGVGAVADVPHVGRSAPLFPTTVGWYTGRMSRSVYVTAHGTKVVPRAPFVLSFRPPRLLVEHGGKAVVFGVADDGRLGFSPLGDASVEDVTWEVSDYPAVPVFALHTDDFSFPVEARAKVFSVPDEIAWPFELQLESAASTDSDEMLHVRGPLDLPWDLSRAPASMKAMAEGTLTKQNGTATWKEWEYANQGSSWRQRIYAVSLSSVRSMGTHFSYAVTAQCRSERRAEVFGFADQLVASMGRRY